MQSGIQEGNLNHNIHSNASIMCHTSVNLYIFLLHIHVAGLKPGPT